MAKILLIHQIFVTPNEAGGTRHYELAKYLVEQGHEVIVIACRINYLEGRDKNKQYEIIDGIRIFYCYAYKSLHKNIFSRALSFLSFAISSFFKALTIKKVDIIWGTSPPLFQSFSALVIAKIRRKKFYYEVRDLWIDFALELGVIQNRFAVLFARLLEKSLYRFSDEIIVNSPGFVPHIQKNTAKKISIIANGVITKDFEIESRSSFFKRNGINSKFIAAYIGNLGIANDIETILQAAQILSNYQDITIVLMGGGIRFQELDVEIKQKKNVYIFPAQKKSEIPSILSEIDVGIATLKNISLFNTTYPNKVFDYMAAKKPTILAIDGAIRDVIEKSKGGKFVPPGDPEKLAEAILYYYLNPSIAADQGKQAFIYVRENFERQKIAQRLSNIFNR